MIERHLLLAVARKRQFFSLSKIGRRDANHIRKRDTEYLFFQVTLDGVNQYVTNNDLRICDIQGNDSNRIENVLRLVEVTPSNTADDVSLSVRVREKRTRLASKVFKHLVGCLDVEQSRFRVMVLVLQDA